ESKRRPTDAMKMLGPKLKAAASIMGMRIDAPEVVSYVTKTLAKKLPNGTSDRNDSAHVVAPKMGLELLVSHDVRNEKYPPIAKTKNSFIPYVSYAWVRDKIGEPPIAGLPWTTKHEKEIIAKLGEPTGRTTQFTDGEGPKFPYWKIVLDAGA